MSYGSRAGLMVALGVAAIAVWALAQDAGAAPTCTLYWTGATSTTWTNSANWSATDGGPTASRLPGVSDYLCMSTAPVRASAVLSACASLTVSGTGNMRRGSAAIFWA